MGRKGPKAGKSYGERLSALTSSLNKASREVDSVLKEVAQVARDRTITLQNLETDLENLETHELELKTRIATLKETPLPAAECFAKMMEPGERLGARRDYVLFGAGVVASTIIALVVQLV